MSDEGFLARWSRRKQQAKDDGPAQSAPVDAPATPAGETGAASGLSAAQPAPPAAAHDAAAQPTTPAAARDAAAQPTVPPVATGTAAEARPEPPLPTLDDVARLTRDSEFSSFMRPGVAPDVKNAALKKLFADPHFNVMDGLDVYIDDYGKPDPLPLSMLRKMAQAKLLGLFDDEEKAQGAKPAAPATASRDENADLQLQPDDAAGREGAGGGADCDPRRVG